MRKLSGLIAIVVLSFGFAGSSAHAQTIAEIVGGSGAVGEFDNNRNDFDVLNIAVDTAGLGAALSDPNANFTVFAPNDRAFIRLARNLGYDGFDESEAWTFLVGALTALGEGDPIPVLTNVLLYHVVPDEVTPFDLIINTFTGDSISTLLEGATIDVFFFMLIDNDPDLRNPLVRTPFNISADNGLIHTISRVLIPVDL